MRCHKDIFIVRIDIDAQKKLRNLLSLKKVAYLGISADVDAETKKKKKWEKIDAKGVIIDSVEKDSPAEKNGFQIGDKIISLNDVPLKNFDHLLDVVRTIDPGSTVTVSYLSRLAKDTGFNNANVQKKDVQLGEKEIRLMRSIVSEMEYNLQYGEILAIGKHAAKMFPNASIGDIALLHHTVEYKPRQTGDKLYNDFHLIELADNGDEIRFARIDHEVFGIMKLKEEPDQMITPHPNWVFCHPHIQKSEFLFKDGLWLPAGWDQTIEEMSKKLEDIKEEMYQYENSNILKGGKDDLNYKKREVVISKIEELNRERERITGLMNKKKLVECKVVFYNTATDKLIGPGLSRGKTLLADLRTLYPLQIGSLHYALAKVGAIEAFIKQ